MRNLILNKPFHIGFWSGLILFAFLNHLSYIKEKQINEALGFAHIPYYYGFPFTMIEVGNYVSHFWFGIIANVLIAVVCSIVVGLVFRFIWSRFNSDSSNLK